MTYTKWIGVFMALIFSLYVGWVVYAHGQAAGYEEGLVKAKGEMDRQIMVAKINYEKKLLIATTPAQSRPATDIKKFWQFVRYEKTFFFISEFSSPPIMKEFGIEENFNYVYTDSGTFAFPIPFDLETMYLIMAKKPAPKRDYAPKYLF